MGLGFLESKSAWNETSEFERRVNLEKDSSEAFG